MSDPTSGGAATGAAWAIPDSRPADAVPTVAEAAAPTGRPAGPTAPAAPPPVPVPLRSLTALERVDGGLRVLKLAPATMLAVAAATVAPVQLLATLVPQDPAHPAAPHLVSWFGRGVAITFGEDTDRAPLGLALVALESVALAVATAAAALLVAGWYAGRRSTTGEVLGATAARLPALVGAWVLVHLAEAVAALGFLVGALVPMVLFAVATPALAVEGLGPVAALRRSVALARRRPALVLGACLTIALADVLLRGALTSASSLWDELALPGDTAASAVVGVAARLVTVPMVAGAITLLYFELRVQVEGYDLDVAAEELWPDAP